MKKNLHAKFLVTIFQILIFSGGLLAQPSGWIAPNTGVNATILIPGGGVTVNGSSISTGDVIGVFFTSGSNQLCGGIIVYDANEVNTALSAWGDDSTTPTKDGFATNEAFIFKVWLAQTNQIVDMIPTFTPLFQIQETYTTNGMYWVTLVGTSAAPSLTASTSVVNSGCFGTCTGAVDLTVSGGTAPYTYLWSNGATTQDLANLCAGTYSVTVSGGGTTTATAIVSTASQLTVNSTHSNVSCFGGANGSISLTVSGGTSPYSFLWNNGSVLQNRTGLVAGTYTVTVTDQNLCTASHIVVITQPNALSSSISGTDVTTVGGSNGSADLSVSGGTLPYSYLWSNAAITQDINGLSAGTFTVTVTDFNGCTTISSVIIGQPSIASLSATIAGTNVSCFGSCNGSADLSVSGGTAPYTYLWSNGALTQDISQLCPGTYSVTVNDAAGTPGVPFTWTYNITAGFGTILISPGVVTISNQAIQVGDYIGVFYQNGAQQNCGGYVQWDGSTTAIAVWGDDSTAPGKQGFKIGRAHV